jgi:hypothetical protein
MEYRTLGKSGLKAPVGAHAAAFRAKSLITYFLGHVFSAVRPAFRMKRR